MKSTQKQQITFETRQQALFYDDPSFWSLIAANLIVIVWAVLDDWPLSLLVAIYWCQSIIIGFFWFLKICELKDYTVNGHEDVSMEEAFEGKAQTASAFICLFLVCHLSFAISILDLKVALENLWSILIVAGIFFVSNCFSFSKTSTWISPKRPTRHIVSFPFVRIIPMFVPLMVAGTELGQKAPLVVFLTLKTLVDAVMHAVEHLHFGDRSHSERTFKDFERRRINEMPDCEFCGQRISKPDTPWIIKEHIVCEACYNKIEREKRNAL